MAIFEDVCTQCGKVAYLPKKGALRCHRCDGTSFIRDDVTDETSRKRRKELTRAWRAQQSPPPKGLLLCALCGTIAAALSFLTTGLLWASVVFLMSVFAGHTMGSKKRTLGNLFLGTATAVLAYMVADVILTTIIRGVPLLPHPW